MVNSIKNIFLQEKPLVGMVHLQPLPGSPMYRGSLQAVVDAALHDADVLTDAGFDGIMIENYGDVPFYPGRVPVETVAVMTRIAREIKNTTSLPMGINVLRNDAISAIAIANAVDAQFIRTNVHVGVTTSEQGWLFGNAHEVLRYRNKLKSKTMIWADVAVKHSYPFVNISLADQIQDAVERALADAIIISGNRTGEALALDVLKQAGDCCEKAGVPLIIGSGIDLNNIAEFMQFADCAIVGTVLRNGEISNPVDAKIAKKLVKLK